MLVTCRVQRVCKESVQNVPPGCDSCAIFSCVNTKSKESEACSLQKETYNSDPDICNSTDLLRAVHKEQVIGKW